MHPKLAHLSSSQVEELIVQYYEGEKTVSALISEYEIDARPSGLVELFPPVVHSDSNCPYCDDQHLISKRPSRTYSQYSKSAPFCPQCNHQENDYCRCQNCLEVARQLEDWKNRHRRELISNRYSNIAIDQPEPSQLPLMDALYLLSLKRHSLSEDLETVSPFSQQPLPLAPTEEFITEITKHLYAKELIYISEDSPTEAFIFSEDGQDIPRYYPTRAIWRFLPGLSIAEKKNFLDELEGLIKAEELPASWQEGQASLWLTITKHECFEYLMHLTSQRNFELDKLGPKTHSVFENLLGTFSVSQIFYLTWIAVRNVTDYSVRENLPKYRAKNMFIGALQRQADKFVAEGWEVKRSRRDFSCPQTVISSTFFDAFMKIGSEGFNGIAPK